ncbi:hypothetical protein SDC9_21303 [bioreactor metagenome]|uniref:Uncharacterized protein n=1 Tax=bioreactor metagenome TaxID=1076179 RepID=A0A644U958_9ZZZZ
MTDAGGLTVPGVFRFSEAVAETRNILGADLRHELGLAVAVIGPPVAPPRRGIRPLERREAKAQMRLERRRILVEMLEPQEGTGAVAAVRQPQIAAIGRTPDRGAGEGMGKEGREIEPLRQADRRMREALRPQPGVIADHPVPGVAHQREGEPVARLGLGIKPDAIRQRRVFPQPPRRLHARKPPTPASRLGRVADQDIVRPRPCLERQRKRRAPGFRDMDEDETAAGRNDHGTSLAPWRGRQKGGERCARAASATRK